MTARLATLIECLDHQLKANGYHLTADELRDVAANALMVMGAETIVIDDKSFDALSAEIQNPSPPMPMLVEMFMSWRPSDEDEVQP